MKTRNKALVLAAVAACALALTGCGERVVETEAPQTEAKTEAVTEAVIVKVTEAPTEKPTEPPTEKQTEAPTETETQPRNLTPEEEVAEETLFDSYKSMYANDDVNIRTAPDTTADNVISSYTKFDEVTVIGETPNWYKILNGGEEGYIRKDFASATYEEAASKVAANTPAETQAEVTQENAQAEVQTVSGSESVAGYADSFPLLIAKDANLRASASENGEVVDVINSNTQVTALGETDQWYQVDYNGTVGYVNKSVVG